MDFNLKQKLIICEVINKESGKRDEKYSYRIGRKCYLPKDINENKPISWLYEDGGICTSSSVESYDEDEYGVWIHTKHRSYDFQYAYGDGEGNDYRLVATAESDESLYEI